MPESKSNLIPLRIGAGDEVSGSPVLLWNTIEAAESKDFLNAFFLLADGTPSSSSMDFLLLSPTMPQEPLLLLRLSQLSSRTDHDSSYSSNVKSRGWRAGPAPRLS